MKHPAVLLFTLFVISESAKIPSDFTKCSRKDPSFHDCTLRAGSDVLSKLTRAYPEVNLPSLEPFVVPELSIATNSTNVQTSQHLKNSKYYGLSKVDLRKLQFDFDKKSMIFEGTFPELRIEGDYQLEGKILLLNLKGEGKRHAKLNNVNVEMKMNFEETKKKGKTYLKFVSGDAKLKPGAVNIEYENLFNDKAISDNINKSLNDNWEDVWEGIEKDYSEILLKIFMNLGNGFFSKVSVEEAFD